MKDPLPASRLTGCKKRKASISMRRLKTHLEEICPSDIVRPGFSPRAPSDEEHVAELAESLEKDGGQRSKVLVTYRDKKPTLIDGGHLVEAAIRKRMRKIECKVYDAISDEQAFSLALRFHALNKPLNLLEIAGICKRLMDKRGWTVEDLVNMRVTPLEYRSQSHVYSICKLLDLDPLVQKEFVTPGVIVSKDKAKTRLTYSHARALTKLPQKAQVRVARTMLNYGMSVHDAEQLVTQTRDELRAGLTEQEVKVVERAIKEGKSLKDFGKEMPPKPKGAFVNAAGLQYFKLLRNISPRLKERFRGINKLPCLKDMLIETIQKDLARLTG